MTAATESWDDVPVRDCYTKVQGQPCGPRHGWASWLNTLYVCPGTRTPGVAVAALDGDGRGVAAPTPPSPPVDSAGNRMTAAPLPRWIRVTQTASPDEYVFPCPNCGRTMDHSLEGHWCHPADTAGGT